MYIYTDKGKKTYKKIVNLFDYVCLFSVVDTYKDVNQQFSDRTVNKNTHICVEKAKILYTVNIISWGLALTLQDWAQNIIDPVAWVKEVNTLAKPAVVFSDPWRHLDYYQMMDVHK